MINVVWVRVSDPRALVAVEDVHRELTLGDASENPSRGHAGFGVRRVANLEILGDKRGRRQRSKFAERGHTRNSGQCRVSGGREAFGGNDPIGRPSERPAFGSLPPRLQGVELLRPTHKGGKLSLSEKTRRRRINERGCLHPLRVAERLEELLGDLSR